MTKQQIKQAALEFIRLPENHSNITISKIQRALRISYCKTALILEELEADGVISSPDMNFKRHLITDEPTSQEQP